MYRGPLGSLCRFTTEEHWHVWFFDKGQCVIIWCSNAEDRARTIYVLDIHYPIGYINSITKESDMQVGDLVRTVWNPTDDVWVVLKVISGDDIPPVVRNPDNKDELFLEV